MTWCDTTDVCQYLLSDSKFGGDDNKLVSSVEITITNSAHGLFLRDQTNVLKA